MDSSTKEFSAKEFSATIRSMVVPLLVSLLLTFGAVNLLCRLPGQSSLTWLELTAVALLYVVIAVGLHALVLLGLSRGFGDHIGIPAVALIEGSWICAAWMPLLVLLLKEESLGVACVPALVVAPVAVFLRRWTVEARDKAEPTAGDLEAFVLFRVDDSPSFLRIVLPAVLISVAIEAGVGALLLDHEIWAGLIFAACVLALIWRSSNRTHRDRPDQNGLKPDPEQGLKRFLPAIGSALLVLFLTGVALMPFLKHAGNRAGSFAGLRRHARVVAASAMAAPRVHAGGAYSGVILYLPQKPKPIVAPVQEKTNPLNHGQAKPMVIPFDGVYWYYQPPDDRPEPDAQVVHGDPAKANVRAKDRMPILMEAHQYLGSSVKMDCCRALRMEILNADTRPGVFYMEVVLRDTQSKKASTLKLSGANLYRDSEIRASLGSVLVASSARLEIGGNPRPVEETLSFPFPAHSQMKRFDEITVIFKPSQERSLVGAQTAIRQFVLVP